MQEIIIGTDFSDESTGALKVAYHWARFLQLPLKLVVASKIYYHEGKLERVSNAQASKKIKLADNLYLKEMLDRQLLVADIPEGQVSTEIYLGEIERTLLNLANKNDGILFLGYKKHSIINRALIGDVVEKIVHLSESPIVLVKNEKHSRPKKMLVGIDPVHENKKLIATTTTLAKSLDSEIIFAHVLSDIPRYFFEINENFEQARLHFMEEERSKILKKTTPLARQLGEAGIKSELVFREHNNKGVWAELLDMANNLGCELICLEHNQSSGHHYLGSTAIEVLRHGELNTLIVS